MSNLFLHWQRAGVAANQYVKLDEDGPGEIYATSAFNC